MINLTQGKLNKASLRTSLDDFNQLLNSKSDIEETELQLFFNKRPQLVLLMGQSIGLSAAKYYNNEIPILNKYRADFVVADVDREEFCFIEFEDAKKASIFRTVMNKKTSTYSWSYRFEHGASQVIDWYAHIENHFHTQLMQAEFGKHKIKYAGALIIGRDAYLSHSDCALRLENRTSKLTMNGKNITCHTYDSLYRIMEKQYKILASFI